MDPDPTRPPNIRRLALIPALLTLLGLGGLVWAVARRWRRGPTAAQLARRAAGLSEEQAAARWLPGQSNQLLKSGWRTRRQMIRGSTLTIFNLNLVFLTGSQLLLGRGLDALITLGILLFNVAVNVFQEEFAQFRVQKLLEAVRPQAVVRRDGRLRRVDADLLVPGDVIHLQAGDPAAVDGRLLAAEGALVDEGAVSGSGIPVQKRAGDTLLAGSILLQGRAICRVERVGAQRRIAGQLQTAGNEEQAYTAIERLLNRVMRVLLVVMIVMGAVLLVIYFGVETSLPLPAIADAVDVVFNLAPAGLFFMVALTYISATADLAQVGAVVHRARSVESLAQCDVICFAEVGLLTGATVEARPADGEEAQADLPEATAAALGAFAHSSAADGPVLSPLRATFAGRSHPARAEMPLMSVYGWCGLAMDVDGARGTYVLGHSGLLAAALAGAQEPPPEPTPDAEEEESPALPARLAGRARALARPLRRLLRRRAAPESVAVTEHPAAEPAAPPPDSPPEPADAPLPSSAAAGLNELAPGGLLGRLRRGALSALSRTQVAPAIPGAALDFESDDSALTFMFTPEVAELYDERGEPQLPAGLLPLAMLSYREELRPETVQALDTFIARNVAIKVFTAQPPERTVALFERGYPSEAFTPLALSGRELATLRADEVAGALADHSIFGGLSGQQTAQIVAHLRAGGLSVGVLGDNAHDIAAMRRADLALTRRRGAPGALSSADMVLLADSPLVLSRVVEKGQRIVHGLLDVLKLYLTQVLYLILLIVGIPLVSAGFPYSGAQGGLIAAVTLTIPAIGLSIWAEGGALPRASLSRRLRRFVLPAGFTMALAGLVVYAVTYARYRDFDYAQLVLTYALTATGLLLVVFISPPLQLRPLGRGDLRPTLLAIVAGVLFLIATYVPLAQRTFDVAPLSQGPDYLLVGAAVAVWAAAVQGVWWLIRRLSPPA